MKNAALFSTFAALALTDAKVFFQNAGKIDGWNGKSHTKGTIQETNTIFFSNRPSLNFTQIYDPGYDSLYHAQLRVDHGYALNEERYYGFAFRLDKNWNFEPPVDYVLARFMGTFPSCDTTMPSTVLWLRGSKLWTQVVGGTSCDKEVVLYDLNQCAITKEKWHRVIIGASWKADKTGFLKIWFDGQEVLTKTNIKTTVSDQGSRKFEFTLGANMWGWYWQRDQYNPPRGATYTVYFDTITIADKKDEADPENCKHI
ncbi:hypothetical protein VTJ83DRAFT_7593 [Remersonia thermophila]|uniref:Polysaccharide lyase n=1 Tax=Remersonia thermophila TaxID=72144 RepID=A0ABR4D418_9PEZI